MGVVDSFPSPGTGPTGLAWDGECLWHADQDGKIYKLNPSTGAVVKSFSSPGYQYTYFNARGLAWDGEYLWHADAAANLIYKIDPSDGSVVFSFNSPGEYPYGLTWDGEYLWHANGDGDKIYKIDPLLVEQQLQQQQQFMIILISGVIVAGIVSAFTYIRVIRPRMPFKEQKLELNAMPKVQKRLHKKKGLQIRKFWMK